MTLKNKKKEKKEQLKTISEEELEQEPEGIETDKLPLSEQETASSELDQEE